MKISTHKNIGKSLKRIMSLSLIFSLFISIQGKDISVLDFSDFAEQKSQDNRAGSVDENVYGLSHAVQPGIMRQIKTVIRYGCKSSQIQSSNLILLISNSNTKADLYDLRPILQKIVLRI
jgi:hypothetical protein